MSQPPPSRQRKAWLPPSLSAVRYPAMPRPTKARTTTTQSGRPAGATTTGSVAARFTFAMGLLFARGRAFCARIIAQSPRRDGSHEPRRPTSPRGVPNERSAPARSIGEPPGSGGRGLSAGGGASRLRAQAGARQDGADDRELTPGPIGPSEYHREAASASVTLSPLGGGQRAGRLGMCREAPKEKATSILNGTRAIPTVVKVP